MSLEADQIRLESILEWIKELEWIIAKHGSVDKVLKDREGEYASSLCLLQIGEIVGTLQSAEILASIPAREIKSFRNLIVHNYGTVNLQIVKGVLLTDIPELRVIIETILKSKKEPS
ncbi:MAG: DUF86 domain-containing protein [Leptospiraceae bacterium]|nr:DUF86 domain-containing protein [Leptospiraceae bacterium]